MHRLCVLVALVVGLASIHTAESLEGTWSFSPTNGRAPGPRYQYSMTRYKGNPIIFGGTKGNLRSGAELNDLWRYNLASGTWEELVSVNGVYPTGIGRWGAALAVYGDDIILFGGCNTQTYLNDLWKFSMTQRIWERVTYPLGTTLPMPRQAFGYIIRPSQNNTMYIMGGIGLYSSLRDMWMLNLDTYAFSELSFNNSIYLPDGHNSTQWTGGKGVSTRYYAGRDSIIAAFGTPQLPNEATNVNYVSEFNFNTRTWTRLATLPTPDDGPEPRNLAASVIYRDSLFVFGGWSDITQLGANHTFRLDLNTLQWEQLPKRGDPDVRDSMNFLLLDTVPQELLDLEPTVAHCAFFFGGWGDAITNDVFYFDPDNYTWYKVHEPILTPLPRIGHAAAVHGDRMVMHGGVDALGNIFNDLWILDTSTGVWTQISPPGAQPPGRHSHGACMIGDEFYIFGGVTSSGLIDDTWHYSFVQGFWIPVTYTFDLTTPVNPPQARRNMGLASASLFLYVVGGKGTIDMFNDVYELDTVTGLWRVVSPQITPNDDATDYPAPRFQFGFGVFLHPTPFSSADTLFNVNVTAPVVDVAFVVWGGLSSTATQLNDLWMFRLSNATWSPQYPTTLRARSLVGAATQGQHKFISIGGQIYEDMVNELTLFNFQEAGGAFLSSSEPTVLNVTNIAVSADTQADRVPPPLASHTTVSIADKLYLFGGFSSLPPSVSTTTTLVPALTSNQVYVFALSPLCPVGPGPVNTSFTTIQLEDENCFMCAPGSYASADEFGNVTCPFCPAGRYSSFFGATDCTLCAPGFFSSLVGASNPVSCVACGAGFYNNVTGASACLECPAGANCPAATITPTFGTLSAAAVNFQPQPLESLTEERLQKQNSVLYGALGNIGLAILVICVLVKVNHEDALKDFDMYPREHRPLCQEHRIMKEWKTSLGGMFSICGIIFVLYFIVIQSLDWLDAVRETRSLIPNLSAPKDLVTKAELRVYLSFQNYGDNCLDLTAAPNSLTGRRSKCAKSISFSTSNLNIQSTELECLYDTVSAALPVCNVTWVCRSCNLTQALGSIAFTLDQPLSYATSIVWNFTTTSGVPPDQVSTYQSAIRSDPGRSFRGASPSIVNLQMTRTLFEDRTGANPQASGYQIEFLTNTTGSQVSAALFQYARSVGFQFNLLRSETTFEIVRESILTTATFIASLLGGVSGVLGGIGALLSVAERLQLYFANEKAQTYTNELGRKMLPENLPLGGREFERHDWIIASLFAPVAARLKSWEAEAKYEPPKEIPPPPPRPFVFWEWALVLLLELGTYSLPLRIYSTVTDDANGDEETYATTILLNFFRSAVFMWISSRLTGNAGFVQHYFKFDKLMARAFIYSFTYIGLLLPSGASAGQSLAVVSEFFFNVCLVGHTRVLQRFHVWTPSTLKIYKLVRLYAPLLFACSSGSYVVIRAASSVHKELVLLWTLAGIDFYNEGFVHVCAFIIRKRKTKAQMAAAAKRKAEREAAKAALEYELNQRQVVTQPATFNGAEHRQSVGELGPGVRVVSGSMEQKALAAVATTAQTPAASGAPHPTPTLTMRPSNASTGSSGAVAANNNAGGVLSSNSPMSPGHQAEPLTPTALQELHSGRHRYSHSGSSVNEEPRPRVSVSDHTGHRPDHKAVPEDSLGLPMAMFVLCVVIEVLSSFSPIGHLYDDSHEADTDTVISTNALGNVTISFQPSSMIDGSDVGYTNGLAITVIFTWLRTLWWAYVALKMVHFNRSVFMGFMGTLDFLTARVLIMQIAFTVNLFAVNKASVAWVSLASEWVMQLVFVGYIRIMFKCVKWHSSALLTLYKLQRLIAPIVCLAVGAVILHYHLYKAQPETYLFYLLCAVLFYADIITRYWHTPALDDPIALALYPTTALSRKEAKATARRARELESFDPRDTRPKASLTTPMPNWLWSLTVAVELLSSTGPVFRVVVENSAENGNDQAQKNNLIVTCILSIARTVLWLYCSERQRGNAMWSEYLVLDNLSLGAVLQTVAYGSMIGRSYPYSGWVPFAIATDVVMALVLAGHIRVMCAHYTWDYTSLYVYRLQRLYTPALWILVGVMYTWKSSDESSKADFVLYLVCGAWFFFDLYTRTTKIKDVAPQTPEQRELERVRRFQREKEARLAAARAREAMLGVTPAAADKNGAIATSPVTVIELPNVSGAPRASSLAGGAPTPIKKTPPASPAAHLPPGTPMSPPTPGDATPGSTHPLLEGGQGHSSSPQARTSPLSPIAEPASQPLPPSDNKQA